MKIDSIYILTCVYTGVLSMLFVNMSIVSLGKLIAGKMTNYEFVLGAIFIFGWVKCEGEIKFSLVRANDMFVEERTNQL